MSEKTTKSPAKTTVAKTALQKQAKHTPSKTAGLSSAPTRDSIIALQRTAGNQAVQRFLAQNQIQTKLTVGPANDHYEQEADRVAAQVMSQPDASASTDVAQRAVKEGEEEELRAKPLANDITPMAQRAANEGEEEELPAQRAVEDEENMSAQRAVEDEENMSAQRAVEDEENMPAQRAVEDEENMSAQRAVEDEEEIRTKPAATGDGFKAGADFQQRLNASRDGGVPIPEKTRAFMEARFGTDFSNVRIHTGGESAKLNRAISAQAFTLGQDIYFGAGKENVESSVGKELLAHELTHVVQQTKGGK